MRERPRSLRVPLRVPGITPAHAGKTSPCGRYLSYKDHPRASRKTLFINLISGRGKRYFSCGKDSEGLTTSTLGRIPRMRKTPADEEGTAALDHLKHAERLKNISAVDRLDHPARKAFTFSALQTVNIGSPRMRKLLTPLSLTRPQDHRACGKDEVQRGKDLPCRDHPACGKDLLHL